MSLVKITDLPVITAIQSNTSNTIFVGVDIPTNITGRITANVLARGLFSNEVLNVGNNSIVYPNVIGQFASNSNTYLQINLQNFNSNGSSDFVASTSDSDNSNSYIDFGISGKTFSDPVNYGAFKAYDGYVYVYGPSATSAQGNLIIGTASTRANIVLMVGGLGTSNVVGRISNSAFDFLKPVYVTGDVKTTGSFVFSDGTTQSTAATGSALASQAAFDKANSTFIHANSAFDKSNSNFLHANAAFNLANIDFLHANAAFNLANIDFIHASAAFNATNTNFLHANAAFNLANIDFIHANAAFNLANTNFLHANAAFNLANTSVQNTAVIQLQTLRLSGNLIANSLNQGIFVDNFRANTAAFTKDMTITGTLTANTLYGNVFFSNIISSTSTSNTIQWFPQYISPAQTDGQVWYSANTISLVQDTDVAGDRPAISKVLFERVYNGTGSAIGANSWARLAGAVTQNSVPYIQLADATSAANSVVEGFVKVGIANGAYGFLYTKGIVSDMDASSFGNNGQILFLSTTPGRASNVAPTGANSVVQVAKILSNGSANGKLQIDIAARQAYGKPNGAILFANNNLIQASNTAIIDEANSTIYVPNGLIFNTRSYAGNQTAITLDFATDTWVRCNVVVNMAVTLSNFRIGSDITLFVTNYDTGAGSSHTITHGCSAVNSSLGATSFTLGSLTTARIKYYSFGGNLANTYCSVSYS
jgi:hypothetical protein